MAKKTIEIEVEENFVVETGIAIMWGHELNETTDPETGETIYSSDSMTYEFGIGEQPPIPLIIGMLETSADQFRHDYTDPNGRPGGLWDKVDDDEEEDVENG